MKKNEPIRLDYSKLKDFARDGYVDLPDHAFIANDFAVLHSFRNMRKFIFTFGQPYRLDELRVCRVVSGHATITVNLMDYEFRAGMLIFLKGGSILQPNIFSPDFDIEAISVSDELLQMLFNGRVPLCFVSGPSCNVIALPEKESAMLHQIIETLWTIVRDTDFGSSVAHSLLTAVLGIYESIYARTATQPESSNSHEREVFLRFINLVHQYGRRERKLSFYADKLCLSQHYLSTLISASSGTTAREWIEKAVISEAKVMLKHTNMLTYQIADELNFPNVSFFCKFFKRLTGMTPLQYQQS